MNLASTRTGVYVHAYMLYACVFARVHVHTHTYIHAYLHPNIHTYVYITSFQSTFAFGHLHGPEATSIFGFCCRCRPLNLALLEPFLVLFEWSFNDR